MDQSERQQIETGPAKDLNKRVQTVARATDAISNEATPHPTVISKINTPTPISSPKPDILHRAIEAQEETKSLNTEDVANTSIACENSASVSLAAHMAGDQNETEKSALVDSFPQTKDRNAEPGRGDATDTEKGAIATVDAASKHSTETRERPESLLVSPLTHPNGVDMFPSLSATEQEQMSWEAFTQAEESIVAENAGVGLLDDASDGGYESEGFSSGSTSAESSVRDYMYENGRRYHRFREGAYNFPNDDVEQEREDMKHAMVKLLCGQKLFFSPIGDNPQEILDIGTGTGIWVIESKLTLLVTWFMSVADMCSYSGRPIPQR